MGDIYRGRRIVFYLDWGCLREALAVGGGG
jgi:hypothetical protein